MRGVTICLLSAFPIVALAHAAPKPCDYGWKPADPAPGVSGVVHAFVPLSPAADETESELLLIQGLFSAAVSRDVTAEHFVAWDGSSFRQDIPAPRLNIKDWLIFDGELVIAGWPIDPDQTHGVLRWSGLTWETMGSGLEGDVNALAVVGGKLYAGGFLRGDDAFPDPGVAVLQGESWHSLADSSISGAWINALAEFNGQLVAGGAFHSAGKSAEFSLAQWDGSNWMEFAGGADGWVGILANHSNNLFVYGGFASIGGTAAGGLARWDGESWHPFFYGSLPDIRAMELFNGDLVAGGFRGTRVPFRPDQPSGFSGVEFWNGNEWSDLATNSGVEPIGGNALVEFQGSLYAAPVNPFEIGVSRYDGTDWQWLTHGLNGAVHDFADLEGELIVGGMFTAGAGGACRGLATWNGTKLRCHPVPRPVKQVVVFNDHLVASDAKGVSQLVGSSWAILSNTTPDARLLVTDQGLIAAGLFSQVNDLSANNIAVWDGDKWSALGDGVAGEVRAITSFSGTIVALVLVGHTGAGTCAVQQWNGREWTQLGPVIMPCRDGALAEYDGTLVLAGRFDMIGDVPASPVNAWSGSSWEPFGNEVKSLPGLDAARISGLGVYHGQLFAVGEFTGGPAQPNDIVAKWDTGQWMALDNGAGANQGGTGHALHVMGGDLAIGGFITFAGEHLSGHWARWGPVGTRGDFDGDGALERSDFELWYECATLPVRPTDAAKASADCLCIFNTDGDGDVDLADFARLQNALVLDKN